MDITLQLIISIISSLAGSISVFSTLKSLSLFKKNQKEKLIESDEKSFQTALNSTDIKILGNYLENVIGNFTIRDYVSNTKIEERVNKYLETISSYVGTTDDITLEKIIEPKERLKEEPFWDVISEEYNDVLKELRLGEPWNALAKLRRHIELTIQDLFNKYNIAYKGMVSVSQQLSLLEREGIIPKGLLPNLKYSISVANKAIHGLDITESESQEAIYHAGIALKDLRRIINA